MEKHAASFSLSLSFGVQHSLEKLRTQISVTRCTIVANQNQLLRRTAAVVVAKHEIVITVLGVAVISCRRRRGWGSSCCRH